MNLYQILWEGRKKTDAEADRPPKTGFALFLEMLLREFWPLIKLNLVFLLACIPVVTIGPALCAMNHVVMTMVQDRPSEIWRDFWQAFRAHWKQGVVCGLWGLLIFCLPCAAMVIYFRLGGISPLFYVLFTAAFAVMLILGLSWVYLLPMVSTVSLPLPALIRQSLVLGIVYFQRGLAALVLGGLFGGVMLLFMPTTLPFVCLSAFSFPMFISGFIAWPGVRKCYFKQQAA